MGLFDKIKEAASSIKDKVEDTIDDASYAVTNIADGLKNAKDEIVESFSDDELKDAWKDVKDSTKDVVKEIQVGVGLDGRTSEEACRDAQSKARKIIDNYSSKSSDEDVEPTLRNAIEDVDNCFVELSSELNYGASLFAQKNMFNAPNIKSERAERILSYTEGVKNHDLIMYFTTDQIIKSSPKGLVITRDRLCFRGKDAVDFEGDHDTWDTIHFADIKEGLLLDDIIESRDLYGKKSIEVQTKSSTYNISLGLGVNEFRAAIVALKELYTFFADDIENYNERKREISKIPLHPARQYEKALLSKLSDLADYKNINALKSYYAAPRIPRKKILNAVGHYAPERRSHEILLLQDSSLLGGAKTGFVITRDAFYSKGLMEKPVHFLFDDLKVDHDGVSGIDYGDNDTILLHTNKESITLNIDLDKIDFENLLNDIMVIRQDYACVTKATPYTPETEEVKVQNLESQDSPAKSDYGILIASGIEANTQIQKYHNERSGHGFAAEDANALNEKLKFQKVEKIGGSNELNGADRVTNGVEIQTKYYNSATNSINAGFKDGKYRYYDKQGNPQLLEIPADQYSDAVDAMKKKIADGQVPGVTDPEDAAKIVKKGSVTYEQAKNIAKGGNIDSLIFDAKNQIITTGAASGIGFCVSFTQGFWSGEDLTDAAESAIIDGLKLGTSSFVTGIATSQILRTKAAAGLVMPSRSMVKAAYKTDIGKRLIERIAEMSTGKALSGAAATNHVAKLMRSNLIVACVTTAATSAPDFYRAAFGKNISWTQFSKNLVANVGTIGGGSGGYGAAALLNVSNPFLIGAMVIVGSQIGGKIGAALGKTLGKDDAEAMMEILNQQIAILASNYMLNNEETQDLLWEVMLVTDSDWLKALYACGDDQTREKFICGYFEPYCEYLVEGRGVINLTASEIDKAFAIGVQVAAEHLETT